MMNTMKYGNTITKYQGMTKILTQLLNMCFLSLFLVGCEPQIEYITETETSYDTLFVGSPEMPVYMASGAYWDFDENFDDVIMCWAKVLNTSLDTLYSIKAKSIISLSQDLTPVDAEGESQLYEDFDSDEVIEDLKPYDIGVAVWDTKPTEEGYYFWAVKVIWDGSYN
jgi:hypothetical protein